jgi:hypothetical protein
MHRNLFHLGCVATAAGALAASAVASAVNLYWAYIPVAAASVNDCLSLAMDAMRGVNVQNVRRSSVEVEGSRKGIYATIVCIATTPRATAVVMVAGDDERETVRTRDDLRQRVAATK